MEDPFGGSVRVDEISEELRIVRADFRDLLASATTTELRKRSNGTKWTNEQLLFHMLFGYLLVRNLLPLVKLFALLPRPISRAFAATLNAATRPFHVINYVGSLGGGRVLGHERMQRIMDNVTHSLIRSLNRLPERKLENGMHFPVGWDPYFLDFMTFREIYHYPTQHYLHHRNQLTLANLPAIGLPAPQPRER